MLEALEAVAKRASVGVRYESFRGDGGLCRIRGAAYIILNRARTPLERIDILARSLAEVELDGMYIPPAVRAQIDRWRPPAEPEPPAMEQRLAG